MKLASSICALTLFVAAWPNLGNAATITVGPMSPGAANPTLHIAGPITSGDTERAIGLLLSESAVRTVALNSQGGDFLEAAKLSELIEVLRLATFVQPSATCSGPCLLLLLGGSVRGVLALPSPVLAYIPEDRALGDAVLSRMSRLGANEDLVYLASTGRMNKPRPVVTHLMLAQGADPLSTRLLNLAACGSDSSSTSALVDKAAVIADPATVRQIREQRSALLECERSVKKLSSTDGAKKLQAGWRPTGDLRTAR